MVDRARIRNFAWSFVALAACGRTPSGDAPDAIGEGSGSGDTTLSEQPGATESSSGADTSTSTGFVPDVPDDGCVGACVPEVPCDELPEPSGELVIALAGTAAPIAEVVPFELDATPGAELLVARGAQVEVVSAGASTVVLEAPATILGLAVGDLDGDGEAELVTSEDGDDGRLRTWHREGTSYVELGSSHAWPGASALLLGDQDGDGDLDVHARTSEGLYVLPLDGGQPQPPALQRMPYGDAQALGDFFEKDEKIDVVSVYAGGILSVESGETLPAQGMQFGVEGAGLAPVVLTADFDGDGTIDGLGFGTGDPALHHSLMGEYFDTHLLAVPWAGAVVHAAAGELDGDGRADVAIVDGAGTAMVRFGRENGDTRPHTEEPLGCERYVAVSLAGTRVAIADVDGDGTGEIAVASGPNLIIVELD